ncbi:hypothetical protein SAMN05444363_2397 [Flavobacterium terrae]|uniref:Uncharacterized protein n=2 Tax=Flavobacterium terrae TaxID=415425 RepID=A0A1M6FXE8_9FLAO|nr:hypothetical protein SAMN05444363_2397 [Flavobacterium terrae]
MLLSLIASSQSSLNDYNMAIIPARFDFQKEDNQYRINSTIKTFLQQKGFEVYLTSDDLPEGFMDYNCNKLVVKAIEENTTFVTKLKVEFRDCKGKLLFATDLAETREKVFAKAYNQVLLKTLSTFSKANYRYSGKTYFDEEADEKIKNRDVENVSVEVVKKEINESYVRVLNKTNQKELLLYRTSNPNVFLSIYSGSNGIVVSKENNWFFEYIDGDKTASEKLDIKL